MTTEDDAKAVVRQYVDAFNRGDLPALRSLLAPDAEIQGAPQAPEDSVRPRCLAGALGGLSTSP